MPPTANCLESWIERGALEVLNGESYINLSGIRCNRCSLLFSGGVSVWLYMRIVKNVFA